MTPLEAILTLNQLPKLGPVRIRRLVQAFGSAHQVLQARKSELMRVDGVGPETAEIITKWSELTDAAAELKELETRELSVMLPDDPNFPPALRDAYDAPLLLYVWGKLEPRDRHAIAVVGTRRASHYGLNATKKLAYQLAHAGFTIISGLARGVDTAAHEAALAAGGRTVAVLGSGLAKIFPAENLGLAERIANGHGAVVSEFPLHTAPDKQTFPQRNRIVAAWSQALLITESPAWSGSLITANLASEYGRPVFAIPGPIDRETSQGCNQLIRNGATLVTSGDELLDDLGQLPFSSHAASPANAAPAPKGKKADKTPAAPVVTADNTLPELPEDEAKIITCLGESERSVDTIIELTDLPPATVSASLLKLEMRRLVRALPGFRYVRIH
jgi:DNA processing protein